MKRISHYTVALGKQRMSKRYTVVESSGIGYRTTDGMRTTSTVTRVLAASTVRKRISDLRTWASGTYDSFSDERQSAALRVIVARHYVTGIENVRTLHIQDGTDGQL